MAAGLSSRFVPLSYDKPKGLTVVKGEVLIEDVLNRKETWIALVNDCRGLLHGLFRLSTKGQMLLELADDRPRLAGNWAKRGNEKW